MGSTLDGVRRYYPSCTLFFTVVLSLAARVLFCFCGHGVRGSAHANERDVSTNKTYRAPACKTRLGPFGNFPMKEPRFSFDVIHCLMFVVELREIPDPVSLRDKMLALRRIGGSVA